MEQNQFSQETINHIMDVIKSHESEIQAMHAQCANMPLEEISKTILMEKFGITDIQAEEIIEDLNNGIAEFNNQYQINRENEQIMVQDQLEDLTPNMSNEERVRLYSNILTSLQLLNNDDVTEEETNRLMEDNLKKDANTLVEEIERLVNDDVKLEKLANVVQDGVNAEAITEIAKLIEMNKDDYRFMTALWLYIAQREKSIQLTDSEIPIPSQMLGVLSSASIEAILATADLKEGKIELKRWQVIMKWILGALLLAGLIYLLAQFLIIGAVGLIMAIDFLGVSYFLAYITLLFSMGIVIYIGKKIADWAPSIVSFLEKVYDEGIVWLTNKLASLKTWLSSSTRDDQFNKSSDKRDNKNNDERKDKKNENETEEGSSDNIPDTSDLLSPKGDNPEKENDNQSNNVKDEEDNRNENETGEEKDDTIPDTSDLLSPVKEEQKERNDDSVFDPDK